MRIRIRTQNSKVGGFTLVETMITVAIVFIMVFAALGAISFSQVQIARDKERAIVSDFAVHYLETLRALPFDDLRKGSPINTLWDGSTTNGWGRKTRIAIPNSFTWETMTETAYQDFAADLSKLIPRNPQIRVDLVTTQVGGIDHTKSLRLEVAWDAPLGKGGRQELRMDMVRVRDL